MNKETFSLTFGRTVKDGCYGSLLVENLERQANYHLGKNKWYFESFFAKKNDLGDVTFSAVAVKVD